MIQCLKITFSLESVPKNFLNERLQKAAHQFSLEGTAQVSNDNSIKIVVCGNRAAVEDFVDFIHQEVAEHLSGIIEVEPFIKQKDYRGVFRIIE